MSEKEIQNTATKLNTTPGKYPKNGIDDSKEQFIYDLRKFVDTSPFISQLSKVGANEIINFLVEKMQVNEQQEEIERLKTNIRLTVIDCCKAFADNKMSIHRKDFSSLSHLIVNELTKSTQ